MIPLRFYRLLPAPLTTAVFILLAVVGWAMHRATGSIGGVLLLVIALYVGMQHFGATQPLTMGELLVWIDGLSESTKTAALSSTITVVGFLVAFYAAGINWKIQQREQLKLAFSTEIGNLIAEVAHLAIGIQIHTKLLLELHEEIAANGPSDRAASLMQHVHRQMPLLAADRQRLVSLSISAPTLIGKHAMLVASIWGQTGALMRVVQSIDNLSRAAWIHEPPIPDVGANGMMFVYKVLDVPRCRHYLDVYDAEYRFLNGLSGIVRSDLMGHIVGVRFSTLWQMASDIPGLVRVVRLIRQRGKVAGDTK